ncbi:serine hydrolase domain-containing protein [soil metagenome]
MKSILIRRLRITFILFLVVHLAAAQTIQLNTKSDHVDYERLARIDTMINGYIKSNWIKGVVTIIVQDNKVVQHKAYGYANEASKTMMQPDQLFRIASQTKAITSAGIMILYEQGKILLDAPVYRYIPEFRNMNVLDKFNADDTTYTTVPAKRAVTIRDLLTHTSGLDYPGIGSSDMQAIYAKEGITAGFDMHPKNQSLGDAMKKLAALPLIHQPGERWTYGLNTDLLGYLIEVVSGQNLSDFLTTNIFEPLGMKDTYFNVPAAKAKRLATVYTEDSLYKVIEWNNSELPVSPDYPLIKKDYFSGGADLTSTAFDYAIFMQMMLNKGKYNGYQILSPRTVEMMTSSQMDFHFSGTNDFGLGFEIVTETGGARGPRNEGSFAWGGYFGTTYWADPKAKLVCLIMTQQSPNSHGDLSAKFQNMVYASMK